MASLPIQKSAASNCVAVDLEIGSQTASLPIQKSAVRNCVAADSEIDSKTASLPIQKLRRCRFRNRHRWWSHFDFTFFLGFPLTLHVC
jgi:hypothetical protein